MSRRSPPPPPPPRRAPKPPKRPGKGRKVKVANLGEGTGTQSVRVDRENLKAQAGLRGFMIYVDNPGWSIRDTWEHGVLDEATGIRLQDVILLDEFVNMATRLKWSKRRKAHWTSVEQRVIASLQDKAVREELQEYEDLGRVRDLVDKYMFGGTTVKDDGTEVAIPRTPAKSLEGLVRVALELDRRRGDKRGRIAAATATAASAAEAGATPTSRPRVALEDNLTQTEALELAKQMARLRVNVDPYAEPKPTEALDEE